MVYGSIPVPGSKGNLYLLVNVIESTVPVLVSSPGRVEVTLSSPPVGSRHRTCVSDPCAGVAVRGTEEGRTRLTERETVDLPRVENRRLACHP